MGQLACDVQRTAEQCARAGGVLRSFKGCVPLGEKKRMLHRLLGIAAVILVIWLIFVVFAQTGGVLINLLWILILIALVWWAVNFFTGRRSV